MSFLVTVEPKADAGRSERELHDEAAVRTEDQQRLLADVAKMTDVSWRAVVVTGHTDSVGNATYNETLSRRRAAAIKSYLVGKGLDSGMVKTDGSGELVPVDDNQTPAGRSRNRRAEIEFQGVRGSPR